QRSRILEDRYCPKEGWWDLQGKGLMKVTGMRFGGGGGGGRREGGERRGSAKRRHDGTWRRKLGIGEIQRLPCPAELAELDGGVVEEKIDSVGEIVGFFSHEHKGGRRIAIHAPA